jgi:gliding motility-associated-like protein
MTGVILTESLKPIPRKIGYFNRNFFTLKHTYTFIICLLLSVVTMAQANIEFVENNGQWDKQVLFRGKVDDGDIFIRNSGITVVKYNAADLAKVKQLMHDGRFDLPADQFIVRGHAFNVDFLGASVKANVLAEKPLNTETNYFYGNDPSKWGRSCRNFQAVTLQEVYPGVDVRYYTDRGFLKYDIIAKPGADISKIALRYNGIDNLMTKNRELVIGTSLGELKESSPYTYQAGATDRKEINCKYVVKDNIVRFEVKNYNPAATLVIDPQVVFCSFSGSRGDNWGFTATYGPDGSMYGGGYNLESGFPVSTGAFQTNFQGETDISLIRLTPDGSNRIFATYMGGSGHEQVHSLVVDNQGNLVLAGRTQSPQTGNGSFPLRNPATDIVGPCGQWDVILMKLSADGRTLIGSKRMGGTGNDGVNINDTRNGTSSLQRNYGDDGRSEVILDAAQNIYLVSCTQSNNFPVTAGAFQTTFRGAQDGLVIKYSPDLSTRLFSSYLGGTLNDAAYVLSLAPNGDIYVAGGTESDNFPGNKAGTLGPAINPNSSGGNPIDGFVAQIANNGSSIIRSTYIGTDRVDQVFGIQFDLNGFPYIMGQTTGNWPIQNAAFSNPGGKQFIAKLQPDLSAYVYSTCFGKGAATPDISPVAFLVDKCENVYISGWGGHYDNRNPYSSASTTGLPVTSDAIKSITDGKDFYFFVLKKDAASQLFGSFFGENNSALAGGDHVDGGTSRFDRNGVIYQAICGNCNLTPPNRPVFPTTPGAWATVNNATSAGCNLTMLKIAMNLAGVQAGLKSVINGVPRTYGCIPLTVDFSDTVANAVSYEWDFGDGSPVVTTTGPTVSHTYNAVGTYTVRLIAIDPNTCNIRDTAFTSIRAGDKRANIALNPVKLPPCTSFNYRFDNLSTAPPTDPFTNTSFTWDFGDGTPRITAGTNSVFHNYTSPGTYNVRLVLTDLTYCNAPDSVTVVLSVAANVVAGFTTPPLGCAPYDAVFTNTSVAGQTFIWDFGDGSGPSTASNPTHLYSSPGTYNVVLIANNPNTCNLTDTARFTISVLGAPTADFSWGPNPPAENTPTNFNNLSSADAVRFKWVFGDGDSLLTSSRLPVQHQYNTTGTFNACLTAYNVAGCPATTCRPVDALIKPVVGVPNAFTPLSGDQNSVVYVRGFGIGKMTFTIWNRWGQKVFETNNRFQGWDGKVKGVVQPMDVYVYTLNVEFTDGSKTTLKGDLTLIR